MISVSLGPWDWAFVVWFLAVTTGVGLWYGRRASKNLDEYFVSGRDLPWWALGTSMVATTFAADTPIVVAGFVVASGIAQNWLWWSFLFGGTLTVFVFSRWWRRSQVFTEIELIEHRYDGREARLLRGFKAVFLGLVANAIIFGWVTKAMSAVVTEVFDVHPWVALALLLALALGYTLVSGLWGVVATDVLQFVMALLGAVLLAVLAVGEVGGLGALVDRVSALEQQYGREILTIFPTGWDAFTASITILVLVQWWAVYYPGAEPGGGGYVAQRMFAAKDENHARAGTLWFIVAHYVLRPWPWVLVALAAIALEPRFLEAASHPAGEVPEALAGYTAERAYPAMFELLPVGLLGLVVASFLAAFMSTITTTLNLSASYLVNDLWLPFFAKEGESEREHVVVARIAVALVCAAGCTATVLMQTAGEGWTFVMELTAGSGLVLILRWIWWRVNAWSEIAAMVASATVFLAARFTPLGDVFVEWAGGDAGLADRLRLVAIVVVTTVVWVTVTLMTRPVAAAHLAAFYERVRPGGAWGPVAQATDIAPSPLRGDLAMWVTSTALVFGALFGIGSALLLQGTMAAVSIGVAVVAGIALRVQMRA